MSVYPRYIVGTIDSRPPASMEGHVRLLIHSLSALPEKAEESRLKFFPEATTLARLTDAQVKTLLSERELQATYVEPPSLDDEHLGRMYVTVSEEQVWRDFRAHQPKEPARPINSGLLIGLPWRSSNEARCVQ